MELDVISLITEWFQALVYWIQFRLASKESIKIRDLIFV